MAGSSGALLLGLCLATCLATLAPPARSEPGAPDGLGLDLRGPVLGTDLHLGWDRGPELSLERRRPGSEAADLPWRWDEFRLDARLGFKLAVDGAAYLAGDTLQGLDSKADIRHARLALEGSLVWLRRIQYKFEGEYATGDWILRSAWVESEPQRWLGRVRFGQQTPPMSLANMMGWSDRPFMEMAAVVQALAPPNLVGLTLGRAVLSERATWRVGLFTEGSEQEIGDDSRSLLRAAGRATGLPVYQEQPGGPRLVHLGASLSFVSRAGQSFRYRSRPESYLAPFLVDTGQIDGTQATLGGLEVAFAEGPLSLQAEWMHSLVNAEDGGLLGFGGFYVLVSWTLTGEPRPYDRSHGWFGRIDPARPFRLGAPGWGALALSGRVSYLDLTDRPVRGGHMGITTADLSWYPTNWLRFSVEVAAGRVTGRPGDEGPFGFAQGRFQLIY